MGQKLTKISNITKISRISNISKIYVFDIDDTLYAPELEYGKLIGKEIQNIMSNLDAYALCSQEELEKIEYELLLKYGTSIAGIAAEGKLIQKSDLTEKSHLIEKPKLLTYGEFYDMLNSNLENTGFYSKFRFDQKLYDFLSQLIFDKSIIYCFTNGDTVHAKRILSKLKIYDLLSSQLNVQFNKDFIISFDTLNSKKSTQETPIICKRETDTIAFEKACDHIINNLQITNNKVKNNIIYVDDSYKNINSARKFGLNTIYVCKYSRDNQQIKEILPNHKILYTKDYEYDTVTDEYQYSQLPYFFT